MKETRKPPFGRYFLMGTSPGPSSAEACVTERCLPTAREMNERQREAAGAERRPVRVPHGPTRAGGQPYPSPRGRGGRTWGRRRGRGQARPLKAEIARGPARAAPAPRVSAAPSPRGPAAPRGRGRRRRIMAAAAEHNEAPRMLLREGRRGGSRYSAEPQRPPPGPAGREAGPAAQTKGR